MDTNTKINHTQSKFFGLTPAEVADMLHPTLPIKLNFIRKAKEIVAAYNTGMLSAAQLVTTLNMELLEMVVKAENLELSFVVNNSNSNTTTNGVVCDSYKEAAKVAKKLEKLGFPAVITAIRKL